MGLMEREKQGEGLDYHKQNEKKKQTKIIMLF